MSSSRDDPNAPLPDRDAVVNNKSSELVERYVVTAAALAALALIVVMERTGQTPWTWTDWLAVAGLTPAGVGGVLFGDKVGLWLEDRGIGRQ